MISTQQGLPAGHLSECVAMR
ncbi:hypothetical protein JNB_11994 [Janibacter sp. HTCC2649]|nr:hypothetical protein JNB_11994 [Janibacter sp. HTCC2649]